jgi:hypothetical protein
VVNPDKTSFTRISDAATTTLAKDLLVNSRSMEVVDGSRLQDPQKGQPGVVWVGNERILYYTKTPTPGSTTTTLGQLIRASGGSSSGTGQRYRSQSWTGTGTTTLFAITQFTTQELDASLGLHVSVNGREQRNESDSEMISMNLAPVGADYLTVTDPAGYPVGPYLQFASGSVPRAGDLIQLLVKVQDLALTGVSHVQSTVVRSEGESQEIPGGLPWLSGPQGLQNGHDPQSVFLLNQPGTFQG